jgi:hypothetical protein
MSANVAFSLTAASVSLLISTASAVKGRWAVAIVFALLVVGFLARALEERRGARREPPHPEPEPPPRHEPNHPTPRRVKPARFKRR